MDSWRGYVPGVQQYSESARCEHLSEEGSKYRNIFHRGIGPERVFSGEKDGLLRDSI